MEQKIKFQVIYDGKTYEFDAGAKLYIFDYGLYHDIDKQGIEDLLHFVEYVYNLYMKDSNQTPLGTLTDYIAENWKKFKNSKLSRYDILNKFYLEKVY